MRRHDHTKKDLPTYQPTYLVSTNQSSYSKGDFWPLRHLIREMRRHGQKDTYPPISHREHPVILLTFETLITFLTIENNNPKIHIDPSIKSDIGQHSQFLRCFFTFCSTFCFLAMFSYSVFLHFAALFVFDKCVWKLKERVLNFYLTPVANTVKTPGMPDITPPVMKSLVCHIKHLGQFMKT